MCTGTQYLKSEERKYNNNKKILKSLISKKKIMIVWKHKYYCKEKKVFFFNCVRPSRDSFHPSTSLPIASYMMQVTLPLGAGRVSQGRAGWDGMVWEGSHFFLQSIGGLDFPSPQTHPSPSHTLFLPYKLTHSSSHPPPRQAKWAEREARQVPGFRGNTPCGRNLPAPFSTPVTCAPRRKSTSRKKCGRAGTTEPRESEPNSRHKKTGQRLTSRRSSDFVRAKSGRVTYL